MSNIPFFVILGIIIYLVDLCFPVGYVLQFKSDATLDFSELKMKARHPEKTQGFLINTLRKNMSEYFNIISVINTTKPFYENNDTAGGKIHHCARGEIHIQCKRSNRSFKEVCKHSENSLNTVLHSFKEFKQTYSVKMWETGVVSITLNLNCTTRVQEMQLCSTHVNYSRLEARRDNGGQPALPIGLGIAAAVALGMAAATALYRRLKRKESSQRDKLEPASVLGIAGDMPLQKRTDKTGNIKFSKQRY